MGTGMGGTACRSPRGHSGGLGCFVLSEVARPHDSHSCPRALFAAHSQLECSRLCQRHNLARCLLNWRLVILRCPRALLGAEEVPPVSVRRRQQAEGSRPTSLLVAW